MQFTRWVPAAHGIVQIGRRVGILTAKGPDDPLADPAAVFIVGLRQHENILGYAATGGDVALAEAGADQLLKILHAPVQAPFGQFLVLIAGDGDETDVDGVAAAGNSRASA